jgi:iron complex transport system substrate-binding protein
MALSFLLIITACHSPVTQQTNNSIKQLGTASECRVIQHRLGKACIPKKPKRIVTLDVPAILDSLLVLGIKPVGSTVDHFGDGNNWSGERYFPALLPELVTGIESVGAEGTPAIEKILALKPDLILIADPSEASYKQLSAIAPTVVIDIYNVEAPTKVTFRFIAQLVGQTQKAEEVLKQYQKRVEEFQKHLGNRLAGLETSVIGHYDNLFWASPIHAPYFQVFNDIGLPIKPVFLNQKKWSTFSIEVIDKYDADILFIIEDAGGSSSFLSQNILIKSLEAVKNKRAYIVNRKIWDFHGMIGANLLLDELYKCLLEGT